MLRRCGSALVNARDSRHLRFHFTEADSEAAHLYELTVASFEPQVPTLVAVGEVTRLEPAAAKLALRCFGVIEVPKANRRTAHLDLASLPGRQLTPFVINDLDHQIVQRQTDTTELFAQAIRRQSGNPGRCLGLAVHHKILCRRHDAVHFPDAFGGKRATCLEEAPQSGQWDAPEI